MRNNIKPFSLMLLSELQPSQLFINRQKLENLRTQFDFSQPESIPPIPIIKLEGRWVMTDGHTRAFAAYLAGVGKVPILLDKDELDWEAYKICVDWCQEAGITQISDLEVYVIDEDMYESRWIARCKRMQNELAEKRK